MKSIISVIIQSALLVALINAQVNPVNPNFNYPEAQKVDKMLGSNFP